MTERGSYIERETERATSAKLGLAKALASSLLTAIKSYCDEVCEDETLCEECPLNIQASLDKLDAALAELQVLMRAGK